MNDSLRIDIRDPSSAESHHKRKLSAVEKKIDMFGKKETPQTEPKLQ